MASKPSPRELLCLVLATLPRRRTETETETKMKLTTRWSSNPASPRLRRLLNRSGRQALSRRSRSRLRPTTFPAAVAVRNERPRRRQDPLTDPLYKRAGETAIGSGTPEAGFCFIGILMVGSHGPRRTMDREGACSGSPWTAVTATLLVVLRGVAVRGRGPPCAWLRWTR